MRRRFDLTDFEWSVIQPLLPNKSRDVPRVDDRRVINGNFVVLPHGQPLGRCSGALWTAHDLLQLVCALAAGRRLGPTAGGRLQGL